MKVITKFFTFVLLLSLVFSISAVAADENITFEQNDILKETATPDDIQELVNQNSQSTVGNAVDDNTVLNNDEQNSLSDIATPDESFDDIQHKIDNAQDGDTIFLNGKKYAGDSLINVNKQITIVGGSSLNDSTYATLNGQHLNRIMDIAANNVVIKGIRFINGNSDYRAAVYWNGDNGNLINCSFADNTAEYGGAVYWHADNGNLINCSFADNTANYGGAVYWAGDEGYIVNCSFTNNSANSNAGGAIFLSGSADDCLINNCSFIGNSADYGGAMYVKKYCRISNSTFINNFAKTTAGAVDLTVSRCLVDGNEFINNYANGTAGAIRIYEFDTAVINNTFQNNTCGADGSIMWIEGGNHSIIGNFINNTNNPIAIYVSWFQNSTIEDNTFAKDENQIAGNIWAMDVYGNQEGYVGRPSTIFVHLHDILGRPGEGFILIGEDSLGTVAKEILIDGKAYFNIILPVYSPNLNLKIIHTTLENPDVASRISTFKINVMSNWANAISNIYQIDDEVFVKCAFDATGMIVMDINGIRYSADIHNGSAIFNISNLANGEYVASLIYSGDNKYSNEEQFIKIMVTSHSSSAVIDVNDTFTGFKGNTIQIPVHVHDDLGNPLTGEITLFGYATQLLVNGSATFNVNLPDAGTMTLVLGYGETVKNIQINVRDDSIKNITQTDNMVTVSLQDGATGMVSVNINGQNYTALVNNSKAIVEIDDLANGNYAASVIYLGDDKYPHDERIIILSIKNPEVEVPVYKISENRDVSVIYSGNAVYKVLVTRDGKAVGGESVTFNFNGKNIVVKSDAKGYVILNLNTDLKVGTYAVKATYNGVSVTNKVKINQVIKASDKKVKKSSKVTKIKITLKKVNGKYISKKTLKIKFNKKTYKVKTNKKGVATWKIKKSMVKKLKVGKKVKYTVTYGKDTLTKKLTIKK